MAEEFEHIEIKIEGLDPIQKRLSALKNVLGGDAMTGMMHTLGNMMLNDIEMAFEEEKSPFGNRWAPRKKKPDRADKILYKDGYLSGYWNVTATAHEAVISNNVAAKYAAIHQFGGAAGRGHKSVIPARPFLPVDSGGRLSPDLEKRMLDEIADALKEARGL